jgi:hypothetical protein
MLRQYGLLHIAGRCQLFLHAQGGQVQLVILVGQLQGAKLHQALQLALARFVLLADHIEQAPDLRGHGVEVARNQNQFVLRVDVDAGVQPAGAEVLRALR